MTPSRPIEDSSRLLRRIRRDELYPDGKRIKKAAFMPRMNGRDKEGLSVSVEDRALVVVHRAKYLGERVRPVAILAGTVRRFSLDAIRAPEVDDPAHALITGIPEPSVDRANAERFAELLAKSAVPYTFSDDAGFSMDSGAH